MTVFQSVQKQLTTIFSDCRTKTKKDSIIFLTPQVYLMPSRISSVNRNSSSTATTTTMIDTTHIITTSPPMIVCSTSPQFNHNHYHHQPQSNCMQTTNCCNNESNKDNTNSCDSKIPGKIRKSCDPKCFFHWKNEKVPGASPQLVDNSVIGSSLSPNPSMYNNQYHMSRNMCSSNNNTTQQSIVTLNTSTTSPQMRNSSQSPKPNHNLKLMPITSGSSPTNHNVSPHITQQNANTKIKKQLSHKSSPQIPSKLLKEYLLTSDDDIEFVPFKLENLPKDYSHSYQHVKKQDSKKESPASSVGHSSSSTDSSNSICTTILSSLPQPQSHVVRTRIFTLAELM